MRFARFFIDRPIFAAVISIIVTLATMTIIDGLRYGVNGPGTYQNYSAGLEELGQASLLGLPVVFLIAVEMGMGEIEADAHRGSVEVLLHQVHE